VTLSLFPPNGPITGRIPLPASKSIANRTLIIRALCEESFPIYNLSEAQDTQTLEQLLAAPGPTFDAGPAGTVFRFMTALLATRQGSFTLTGSERMKQRPIGILVDALRSLGANIEYLEQEGYPPLKIHGGTMLGGAVQVNGSVSSQFISALLMIGPVLPGGLQLEITGQLISQPYVDMTARLMRYFGAEPMFTNNVWQVPQTGYRGRALSVESDWSAASYWYAMAALSLHPVNVLLDGLYEESMQGDAVSREIFATFGVKCTVENDGIRVRSMPERLRSEPWNYNYIDCPDLAQTFAVVCAGQARAGTFTGLQSLVIKETDRVQALMKELAKFGVTCSATAATIELPGTPLAHSAPPSIATYHDHRMAMAFATLALRVPGLQIENPEVVGKSYPTFWNDLEHVGFTAASSS